jgi:ABC-2 type transport system permease protein
MSYLQGIWILVTKELKDNFYSPVVYILSALFCLSMGWLFFNYLYASKELTDHTLTQSVLLPIFGNMNFIFLFLAPILTMRSFTEEKKLHTLELLLTSKLDHFQIIMAKLFSNLILATFMIMLTLIFPIILAISGYDHWPIVFSSYLGIILSIFCYLSVGLFASAMSDNFVVAALLGFSILLGIMLLSLTGNATDNVLLGQMVRYLAVPFHFENFVNGGMRSYNFVYIFSFIGFFIYLTHIKLESRKW